MSALLAGGTADKEVTDLYSATNLLGRARALAPKLRERSYATNKAGQIPAETIEDFWDFKLKIYYGRENSAARQCVPMRPLLPVSSWDVATALPHGCGR